MPTWQGNIQLWAEQAKFTKEFVSTQTVYWSIIPCLLVFLNLTIYGLKKTMKNGDIFHQLSLNSALSYTWCNFTPVCLCVQVSLAIVVIFILCHSLRWIPNIWELKQAGAKKVTYITYTLLSLVTKSQLIRLLLKGCLCRTLWHFRSTLRASISGEEGRTRGDRIIFDMITPPPPSSP